MGNQFSNGNNLYIQVDRPYYFSGDTVSGVVALNCVSPFQANSLMLKVEGYEKTQWEERREDRTYDNEKNEWITRDSISIRSGHKDFFKLKVPLASYSAHVNPGQYQFAFSFVLPPGLPGSFEFCDNNAMYGGMTYNYTKAKIKYKVRAEAEVPGLLKPNIRSKLALTVHQRMLRPPTEVVASDSKHIKTCCCGDRGYAHMKARVQRDSYYPGEVANVILEVDNQSSISFDVVKLELERVMTLKADGAGYREVKDTLAHASYPGIGPGSSLMNDQARVLSLNLPPSLLPTSIGYLIHCEYRLVVELKAGTFTSNARLKVPVAIYPPVPQYAPITQPPPYWHPEVVAPAVQVELPSAPPLPPAPQMMMDDRGYQPPQPMYSAPQ